MTTPSRFGEVLAGAEADVLRRGEREMHEVLEDDRDLALPCAASSSLSG